MKKPVAALFEINDNNELVMSCKGPVGESHFVFSVPEGYTPSDHMPNHTCDEWMYRIQDAKASGELSGDLADKMILSLQRLPDLSPNQKVCVSFSLGKDSEAVSILAAMKYDKEQLMMLFADTEDEWPETYNFHPIYESWIGIPITPLKTEGIHRLLRERMPFWPMMGRRHCTKNLKMLPQRDYLDEQGFDQVRKQGRAKIPPIARFRDKTPIEVKQPAPLMLCGERWAESENRSQLPYESRDDLILRYTQRPVLEFTIEEVWEMIFWVRAPFNQVYHYVKRCACAGCPFASNKEIEILGERHPQMLEEWCVTEKIIGYPWKKVGFRSIYMKLVKERRLGKYKVSVLEGTEKYSAPARYHHLE
ncbi:phosphoadenosine phosphosulfate reductase family protein [Paenibacillus sp. NPDC093718]|uniref:phosphoadenosine phosphosulfate reductase domain-containing protein n=1 Tax=Paenibacillus sp. NPDC093718 TaxID=3390601 RepID=UPI003D0334D1